MASTRTESFERKISETKIYDHDYYGPLIDSYVKSILKSGLLLDEDLEVLLGIFKFRNVPEQSTYKPSWSFLATILPVLGSLVLAKKYRIPLLTIPSVIIAVSATVFEYQNVKRMKANEKVVNELIETLKKIQTLNLGVMRYMKTRTDLGKAKEQFITLYNKSVEEFFETFKRSKISAFQFITDNIKNILELSDELVDDYKCLKHLNYLDILESDCNNENCLLLMAKIQDIHVLLTSKLLSYIGIAFSSKRSNLHEHHANIFINEKLPMIVKYLEEHHDTIKKQFISLRHSVNKKAEYKQVKTSSHKHITTKLQGTLVYSVNNLSVILEKAQSVLDRVENSEDNDLQKVCDSIVDLRNHTFATYESLDLLCKLYGILANSEFPKQPTGSHINASKADPTFERERPTVNHDDSNEPVEEKYELYIGEEDTTTEFPATNYVDQSEAYLSLMLQELRQSLKQHQRFIDAKNRRGSEDDADADKKDSLIKSNSSPKFNLSAIRDEAEQKNRPPIPPPLIDTNKEKIDEPIHLPMPPPPPLPSFNFNNLEEETGRVNARSMLDNIKTLSSQRNVQEDVFGDSDVDSDSSEEE